MKLNFEMKGRAFGELGYVEDWKQLSRLIMEKKKKN